MTTPHAVRVAAVQAAPVFLDLEATLRRLEDWTRRAANAGASVMAFPVYDEETLVIADCDLGEITREAMTLDVSGHYSRRDVLDLVVRPSPPRL